jgi:hypothetical protein
VKIDLTKEQVEKLGIVLKPSIIIDEKKEIVKIGEQEYIVLDETELGYFLLYKSSLGKVVFGDTNDYRKSNSIELLNGLEKQLLDIFGEENLFETMVDLRSKDGLDCYGVESARVHLLTLDIYAKYVKAIDKFPVEFCWWLATPSSTKKHNQEFWVERVDSEGVVDSVHCSNEASIRPFIYLSKKVFDDEE